MSTTWKYIVLYLILLQFVLGLAVPTSWVYDHRVPYEAFKDDHRVLDLALDHIERRIRRENLEEYVILLGDSVAYSGPGGPEQSIGCYMEELSREAGRPITVFNLAQPSMQTGDIYTVLLELKRRGISTERVVINLLYGGFVARSPDPPVVFWLSEKLRQVDPETWARWADHLAANGRAAFSRSPSALFDRYVTPRVPLLAYRGVLRDRMLGLIRGSQETYDTRPWTEKTHLEATLAEYQYQRLFDPNSFVMTRENPQIDFLERIIEAADGPPLFFLSPTNQVLMAANVSQPGYQENLERIDAWFAERPVGYLNLEHSFEDRLFADHLHLTPEGYRALAEVLLDRLYEGGK